jgi:predicted nucleic acid-binding protein
MDDHHVLRLHDTFFNAPEMTLLDITNSVIDKATELRATYRFKTPDALHLASAIVAGASAFITADIQLRQCRLVNVEIV